MKKNELTVSKEKVEELNKNYDIPPALINNAVKTTKMINGSVDDFEELIENVAKVVDKKKVVKQEPKKSMGDYNVDLINANMDINVLTEKIKSSNKLNFSMCLYGEPGTSRKNNVVTVNFTLETDIYIGYFIKYTMQGRPPVS